MRKEILTKEANFTEYIDRPLVSGDINAYEITLMCNEDLSGCVFQITAERADGKIVSDIGEIKGNKATYLISNSMYQVPGELKLRLKIMSQTDECLTAKELLFTVLESDENKEQIEATEEYPLLMKLMADTKDACEKAECAYNLVNDKVELLAGYLTINKSTNKVNSKCDIAHEGRIDHNGFLYHEGSFHQKGNALFYNNINTEGTIVSKGDVWAQNAMDVGTNLRVFGDFTIFKNGTVRDSFIVENEIKAGSFVLDGRDVASVPKNEVFDEDDKILIFSNHSIFDIGLANVNAKGSTADAIRFVLNPSVVPEVSELKACDIVVITANDDSNICGIVNTVTKRSDGNYSVDFNGGTAESALREMTLAQIREQYKSVKVVRGYEWKSKTAFFEEIKEYLINN